MSASLESVTAACRIAQGPWSELSLQERLRGIRTLRHRLVERAAALCEAVQSDVARPAAELTATDLLPTAAALKFLERNGRRLLAPRRLSLIQRPLWLLGSRDVVHRRPWGVVGIIGTWNYPILLNVVPIAQALAAGNGVVWKPSEQTPRTAEVLQDLFAGFPAGLLQVLPATREGGSQLAEADVDHIVFTGSDAVGRRLAARLGERLVPSTLELSGSDAMLVLADADIDLAARTAWFGTTLNRGQTCIAVRRILVARERETEFVEALKRLAQDAKPIALQTPAQVEQMRGLIADAEARGAALVGSKATDETLSATFLVGANPESRIFREACFAPIAAIVPFDTTADALRIMNASPFGLSASIHSRDVRTAEGLALRVRAGSVMVNDALVGTAHPAVPFGGVGASGWGVTRGAEGLLAMTVPQSVSVRRGSLRPHLDEAIRPDPASADILMGVLQATHARGFAARLRGIAQLVRGVRRRR